MPLFMASSFLKACPGFYPLLQLPQDSLGDARTKRHPVAPEFSNFDVFYAMLYNTRAGDVCRASFGEASPQGLWIHLA
ncbi:unnamed protein product [Polarella glacialis]|uniref:Uncharacterized protein n=1 Tax=Polarella glacialis TaxID=89957 RepID=A0A813GWV0_POLGL|nr:unnamed protein product [Polarella glacialis]